VRNTVAISNLTVANLPECAPVSCYIMDRRTHDGWMDWEYHSQPPVDPSSPFATFSQTRPTCKFLLRFPSNPRI
jgi:hypothetical protein